ncbi:carbon storage regulator [Zhongshania sp. BJYM1]|uniref:carbon storage regulator n=1 Tax=Zhongshania aquatica TaxID=2965069 RepID=UPI00331306E1
MLSLTRREGQSLHVGDDVVITIERVEGKKVKVSIEAPCSVKILRSELVDVTVVDEISSYKN